ncbi:hypothetical protein RMSM_02469 [Rhodopirellula maiorica SM1]|uniref:Uncharacterized protein n=1 Tax=Rhodopirellula maiorica SM1 TaxID=1265738 RepID=M5RMQ5_9BACT|nr:hypothetical protein RMSM_02469 [Rhodopirellula maiorica SM1]
MMHLIGGVEQFSAFRLIHSFPSRNGKLLRIHNRLGMAAVSPTSTQQAV